MAQPEVAVGRLAAREVRNGVIALVVGLVVMVSAVVKSFTTTSLASAGGLDALLANPAVRALYGMPFDVTTAGGFAVWRAGTFICVIAGLWGVMASTRVLRGEEEAGRWDLLLTASITRGGTLGSHAVVLTAGSVLAGLGVASAFIAGGEPAGPAALYAAGVALLTLTFVGVGMVTSQLWGVRRRASGIGAGVLGAAYLVRMVADGIDGGSWLRWASPLGWVENLEAFAGNHLLPLVPLAVTPVVLIATAVALDRRRDTDEGIVRDPGTAEARTRFLRDPLGFAWRQRQGGLIGWGIGLLLFGLIMGAITKAFVDFIAGDPEIAELTAQFGFSSLSSAAGFVASMDALAVVVVCLYVVLGIHHLGEDEQADRLDLVYAAPVSRTSWLTGGTVATGATAMVAMLAIGLGTWLGVALTGVDFGLDESLAAILNCLPLVVLTLGWAVAVHGVRPAWVVPVGGGAVVVLYLLSFLGPAVNAPEWLIDLSPWAHVAVAPPDPVNWAGTVAMVLIGIVLGAVGFVVYTRRDLQ